MQLRKKPVAHKNVINIASLIDVIFLLIIFFMTVSQSSSVTHPTVTLPVTEHQRKLTPIEENIIITLTTNSDILINTLSLTLEQTKTYLTEKKNQDTNATLSVRIRADENTPWQFVSEIMTQVAKLNITEVNIGVIKANG